MSWRRLLKTTADEVKAPAPSVVAYPGCNATEKIVLSARDVSIIFGTKQVLKNISLDVHEGEKIMLSVENGCGKTTFTRIMARLLKPDTGLVESVYCSKASRAWFKNIGYVYQNSNYQLFMSTVEREIDFACVSEELKAYVIERLQLSELLNRHPFSLSEGQKRKLAVAAIVCSVPHILFLDEPTVGQDNESLAALIEVLLHLNQTFGTALVCVSHDKLSIEALCDRKLQL